MRGFGGVKGRSPDEVTEGLSKLITVAPDSLIFPGNREKGEDGRVLWWLEFVDIRVISMAWMLIVLIYIV